MKHLLLCVCRGKRRRAAQEAKVKLRSPNFCISPLRLSVRNIPISWNEARLKSLFISAVKERATKEQPHVKQVGGLNVLVRLHQGLL